jgi:hypothetical protein
LSLSANFALTSSGAGIWGRRGYPRNATRSFGGHPGARVLRRDQAQFYEDAVLATDEQAAGSGASAPVLVSIQAALARVAVRLPRRTEFGGPGGDRSLLRCRRTRRRSAAVAFDHAGPGGEARSSASRAVETTPGFVNAEAWLLVAPSANIGTSVITCGARPWSQASRGSPRRLPSSSDHLACPPALVRGPGARALGIS